LENYSFIRFVVDTYEAHIAAPKRSDEIEDEEGIIHTTSARVRRGRPSHQRSCYIEPHPRRLTYSRVIRPKGHNTLPNIIGPFIPSPKDQDRRALYCASIMTLLVPWRNMQDINQNSVSWEEKYDEFFSQATQEEKDVIAGVEYYYECRMA
ncbi:hypothetical protein EV363DRAFT_1123830, partial [Boletus edulis]